MHLYSYSIKHSKILHSYDHIRLYAYSPFPPHCIATRYMAGLNLARTLASYMDGASRLNIKRTPSYYAVLHCHPFYTYAINSVCSSSNHEVLLVGKHSWPSHVHVQIHHNIGEDATVRELMCHKIKRLAHHPNTHAA